MLFAARCNGFVNCIDGSDEVGCECKEDEFECECHKTDPLSCVRNRMLTGCITKSRVNDGYPHCPDGSDERHFRAKVVCDQTSTVTIRRLANVSECTELGCTRCDNSTCIEMQSLNCNSSSCNETEVLCSSCPQKKVKQECRSGLQCADGTLIGASQFCDRSVDCFDQSDEMRNRPGFKCSNSLTACVLPQQNLFDDYPHCLDRSDLCMQNKSCFQCLDKSMYISPKQVCNGVFDCPDLSDECLCQNNLNSLACNVTDPVSLSLNFNCRTTDGTGISSSDSDFNGLGRESNLFRQWSNDFSTKLCDTKKGVALVTLCDGRPECRDLSDECESGCADPPPFCNDSCHFFYPIGDRYCDGYIDEAWVYINSSECPRGFDERDCPKRFYCTAGDKLNIEISKVCDGVPDCDDLSDEQNCSSPVQESLFFSKKEMISSQAIKSAFWIIGFVVITGNLYVIISTFLHLRNKRFSDYLRCQRVILLNIAIADLIMGIYLMTIAIYSIVYSGRYGEVDHYWRTSLNCSFLGSLVVLSSEASCLLLVILTAFRLYTIWNPVSSATMSSKTWNVAIAFPWVISLVLAVIPLPSSNYFVYDVLFENEFSKSGVWDKCEIERFAYRLAKMTNTSIEVKDNQWDAAISYLHNNFPRYYPQGEFGYYGETSICMPRFYVAKGEHGWEYSLAVITINFVAFIFIAVSYVVIYWISTNHKFGKKATTDKQESAMQKRIARIIFTDFACWIPICVIAYIRLSGIFLEPIVYQISAALLLPINSALNPILYSTLEDKIGGIFCHLRKKRKDSGSLPVQKLPVSTSTTKVSKLSTT